MKVRAWLLKKLSDGLARAGNEIAGELKHKVAHGSHEMGALCTLGQVLSCIRGELMTMHRRNDLKSKGKCNMVLLFLGLIALGVVSLVEGEPHSKPP